MTVLHKLQAHVASAVAHQLGRLSQLDTNRAKDGSGIAHAKRREQFELTHHGQIELPKRRFSIEADFCLVLFATHLLSDCFEKCRAEGAEVRLFDPQACRRGMATSRQKQGTTLLESCVQVHAVGTAGRTRTGSHPEFVERDQHHGTMVFLRQFTRDDADNAWVPGGRCQYEGGILFRRVNLLDLL